MITKEHTLMKKTIIYVILALFEITLGLIYGFILKNIFSIEICLAIAFLVPFVLVLAFSKKENDKMGAKFLKIFVIALVFAMVCGTIFISANAIKGEFIGEYEVVVESISGHGGGRAGFTSPYGTYEYVDLNDYRIILTDEDDYVDVGDTILVKEYKGIFDMHYYIFVEEIH